MGTNQPFAKKTLVTDVLAFDYYPYERALWPNNTNWIGLADLTLALDRLSEWNYHLAPIMTWIETCDVDDPEEVKSSQVHGFVYSSWNESLPRRSTASAKERIKASLEEDSREWNRRELYKNLQGLTVYEVHR